MNAINVIAPYKWHGMWVFYDPRAGLVQEPFVAGADTMIDQVVADIPDAEHGFTLIFSTLASAAKAAPTLLVGADAKAAVAVTKATAAGQAAWHRLAHHRGVEYVPTMIDIDGKPFATALVGVVTLATGYVAEVTDWALLALPLSVMVGHYLAFRSPAEPATPDRRAPVRATEPIAAHGVGGLPTPSGAVPAAFYPDRPAA